MIAVTAMVAVFVVAALLLAVIRPVTTIETEAEPHLSAAKRRFGTRGIDPRGEATTLHIGIAGHLDGLDDRVGVRPYQDLVQGLVVHVRPEKELNPVKHQWHRSGAAPCSTRPP